MEREFEESKSKAKNRYAKKSRRDNLDDDEVFNYGAKKSRKEEDEVVYDVAVTLMEIKHEQLSEEQASTLKYAIKKGKETRQEDHHVQRSRKTISSSSASSSNSRGGVYGGLPLPSHMVQGIDASCMCVPFQKLLTETDLKDNQMRLSLSKYHVERWFLPMLKKGEDVKKGIWVTTYDSQGKGYTMKFVFWTSKMYVLTTTGWKQFYRDHGLQERQQVTVWMFRKKLPEELCFAITWPT